MYFILFRQRLPSSTAVPASTAHGMSKVSAPAAEAPEARVLHFIISLRGRTCRPFAPSTLPQCLATVCRRLPPVAATTPLLPAPPSPASLQRADPGSRPPDAPPVWGQVVVGPPGAGKSTYCAGMQQFLALAGRRAAVINLDPANDPSGYTPGAAVLLLLVEQHSSVFDLWIGWRARPSDSCHQRLLPAADARQTAVWPPPVPRHAVTEQHLLCVGVVQRWTSASWCPWRRCSRSWGWAPTAAWSTAWTTLKPTWIGCATSWSRWRRVSGGARGRAVAKLFPSQPSLPVIQCCRGPPLAAAAERSHDACCCRPFLPPNSFPVEGTYLLFDLPGQVELFTLHGSLRRMVDVLTRRWRYRLTAVQLVDAHLCRYLPAAGHDAWWQLARVRAQASREVSCLRPCKACKASKACGPAALAGRGVDDPTSALLCSDPAKYLSALLLSLSTMLHLELPQASRTRGPGTRGQGCVAGPLVNVPPRASGARRALCCICSLPTLAVDAACGGCWGGRAATGGGSEAGQTSAATV